MDRIEREVAKTLKDVETIHALIHPLDVPDPRQKLFMARSRKEDAVRLTILQIALSIEDMIDCLFWRSLAGHDPDSKKRKSKKKGIPHQLDELLTSGRLRFEAKLKLARILGIITKKQHRQMEVLNVLRNKCAHNWMLDVARIRGTRIRPAKRLLEYEGKNLFDLEALQDFMHIYGRIYLRLLETYIS
ncbi:MAG: hypothetical protein ACRD4R_03100 [Candidatus Acidiferrales bacterium]